MAQRNILVSKNYSFETIKIMHILWTSAILTGFVGSLHCVGMCGPIALALPVGGKTQGEIFLSRIFYNLGRITTYGFIGLMMGLVGEKLFFSGIQQELSISIGIVILLIMSLSHKTLIFKPLHLFNTQIKSQKIFLAILFKEAQTYLNRERRTIFSP